jgi:hypothetical protein
MLFALEVRVGASPRMVTGQFLNFGLRTLVMVSPNCEPVFLDKRLFSDDRWVHIPFARKIACMLR